MTKSTVTLRIYKWDPAIAWGDNIPHVRNTLVKLLREATAMTHTEAKRFVRQVLAKNITELVVSESGPYESIRHNLEVLGASVQIDLPPPGR